jgi:membrane protein DedA with SNARE-associated domain
VYAVLALLAAVENVVPPVPSDAAVALGAFLSHRGLTSPPLVFLVTWTANLLGAAGVYFAARRYGRRLFATSTGRRLLAPRSLAVIEREYMRFGVAGIFISRFLPGVRAVVPPFAGLVDLGWIRTLGPMGLASAIWYGGITVIGALLGAEWSRIVAIIAGVNRTLAIVAGVGAVAGGIWFWLARRRRKQERVWHATRDALTPAAPSFLAGTELAEGSAREAAALLVLELAYPEPPPEDERRSRFADYAAKVRERFGRSQRLELVERMWLAAFSDGSAIGAYEDRLMSTAAELLGVDRAEVTEMRRRLSQQQSPR